DRLATDEHSGGWRGIDNNSRCAEPAIKEELCNRSAERVTDQDRLFGKRLNFTFVVLEEANHADVAQIGMRAVPQLGRGSIVKRPGGGKDGVSLALIECLEAFPTM